MAFGIVTVEDESAPLRTDRSRLYAAPLQLGLCGIDVRDTQSKRHALTLRGPNGRAPAVGDAKVGVCCQAELYEPLILKVYGKTEFAAVKFHGVAPVMTVKHGVCAIDGQGRLCSVIHVECLVAARAGLSAVQADYARNGQDEENAIIRLLEVA